MTQNHDTPDLTLDSAEALEKYRLVRHDGSGDAVYCDAGEVPLGANGAYVASGRPALVTLLGNKPGTLVLVASGAISAYADVFADDDGKVTATNTGYKIGKALATVTADDDLVEVLPEAGKLGLLYANITASTAVGSNSSAVADFDKYATIPAGVLAAGDVIRVRAKAKITGIDSTPQCTVALVLGTENIVSSVVAAGAANDICVIDAEITVSASGASGKVLGSGFQIFDASGTAAKSWEKAEASEDLSAAVVLKCTGKFDAEHASNLLELQQLTVELVRK